MPSFNGKIVINAWEQGGLDDYEVIGGYKVVQKKSSVNEMYWLLDRVTSPDKEITLDTIKRTEVELDKHILTHGSPVYVATGDEKGLYRWDSALKNFVKDESGGGLNEEDLKATFPSLTFDSLLNTNEKSVIGAINEVANGLADLLYKPISITSFNHNQGVVERGTTVSDVTLSWSTNKTPKSLTLDGVSVLGTTSKSFSGLSIRWDANKTWNLSATDERNKGDSKNTSITFQNGVYYGVATEPKSYTSSFILGLTKQLSGSKVSPITVNAVANQYIYYCVPSRFGECVFTVGVLSGGFRKVATINFTNSLSYAEQYYIYRSNNANLGETTVKIT